MALDPYEYIHFFGKQTIKDVSENILKRVNQLNGVFVLQYPFVYHELGIGMNFAKVGDPEFQIKVADKLRKRHGILSEQMKNESGKDTGIWVFWKKGVSDKLIKCGRKEAEAIINGMYYD